MSGNTESGRLGKNKKRENGNSFLAEENTAVKVPIPEKLKGEALGYWKKIMGILQNRGNFSEADSFALERLAVMFGEWQKLESVILENGMTYDAVTDRGSPVIRERPEAKLMINLNKEIKDLERRFGLTPYDRRNIGGSNNPESIRNKYQ